MTDETTPDAPGDSEESGSDGPVRPVIIEPRRRSTGLGLIWLVPVAALFVSIWIAIESWADRGPRIAVEFAEVHGLEAGDSVRCRGVEIGRVEAIEWSELASDGEAVRSIRVSLAIRAEASDLIRDGTRFWIARPEFDYGGIRGLETVVGPRYLALSPGTGELDRGPFIGLEMEPVEGVNRGDDLEIVIESPERRGMRRGGLVTYRGLPAGRILAVELAADASRVEARVSIDRRHATLVRETTRFFSTSGITFEFGLDGLRADVESLESLVSGGIAFATPPNAGDRAVSGARFVLAPRPEEDWLEWRPEIALGAHAAESPPSVRASLRWTEGIFGTARSRRGWLTRIDDEFVAIPATLLDPPQDARNVTFECAGTEISLDRLPLDPVDGFEDVRILRSDALDGLVWGTHVPTPDFDPTDLSESETLLVHLGGGSEPTPVAAGRWRHRKGEILIDEGMVFADEQTGAPITHAGTGALLGVLILDPEAIRVGRLRAGLVH